RLSNLTGNKAFNSVSCLTPCKHLTSRSVDNKVEGDIELGQLILGCLDNSFKLQNTRSFNVPLHNLIIHKDKVLCVIWADKGIFLCERAGNKLHSYRYSPAIS
ncbi:hypothetical protein U0070_016474, partial [Myodes glareolus]